jgi:hypothetical protein
MPFFEAPDTPPQPQPPPRSPEWLGPPNGVLPGVLATELVIAEGAQHAICVSRLCAYPTGFTFELLTLARSFDAIDPQLFGPHAAHLRRARNGPSELEPDELRYGVQFADERKATNLAHRYEVAGEAPPSGILLRPNGGSGGGRSYRQDVWVWPLPPPGPLAFVCEWPAAGIELTRYQIDAAVVLDAAARARTLWPDDEPEA